MTGIEEIELSASALNHKWQKLQKWQALQGHGQRWVQILAQGVAAVGVRRWKLLIMVLLAAWVLASLARLVWLLVPFSPAPAADPAPPINSMSAGAARIAKNAVDIEAMVAWHLFGEVGAQPRNASAAAVEEQAKETTLNLQLLGLVSASEPSQSLAIIMADGTQQHLKVGEQLPGGGKVVLNKVLLDRVIIDNNGRYETLWLYDPAQTARQPGAGKPLGAALPPQNVDHRNNAQVTNAAQNYRQQLYKNPSSLADVVQVSPANENGKLKGYRINPGRDPKQFQQFGFKAGDIVTSINGVTLDDPQRAMELYNVIRTAQEAAFTVRRGDQDVTLTVSLQDANQQEPAPPQEPAQPSVPESTEVVDQ
jgi:general secretion pathway protein C